MVFGFGLITQIFVGTDATDMRKGFNGLYGLVRDRLECDPTSGHIFSVQECVAQFLRTDLRNMSDF